MIGGSGNMCHQIETIIQTRVQCMIWHVLWLNHIKLRLISHACVRACVRARACVCV